MTKLSAQIIVCGGSLGGTLAAYSAAKSGKSVILTEETDWIGGQLTSQAVPPDEHAWIEYGGCTATYRAYRNRVREHYLKKANFLQEVKDEKFFCPADSQVSFLSHPPKLAHEILSEMLKPYEESGLLKIILNAKPAACSAANGKINSVTCKTADGDLTLCGDIFIDGTDTGELIALSGIPYRTGAEAKSQTGERRAPDVAMPDDMQPFVYTAAVENRRRGDFVIPKPAEYEYFRKLKMPYDKYPVYSMFGPDSSTGRAKQFGMFDGERGANGEELFPLYEYRRIFRADNYQNSDKLFDVTLINWPQNDFYLGNAFDCENAEENMYLAKQFTLGFVYWLQTEAPRADGGKGYPYLKLSGELLGTDDGLSKSPYIRESRRINSLFTITDDKVVKGSNPEFSDSVGVGSYAIDIHITTKTHTFFYEPTERFTIPLGAMICRDAENLIPACKNIGTTHLTNGCYRLHPIEWNIGEVAGYLAAYVLNERIALSEVRQSSERLTAFQGILRDNGIQLSWRDTDVNIITKKGRCPSRRH